MNGSLVMPLLQALASGLLLAAVAMTVYGLFAQLSRGDVPGHLRFAAAVGVKRRTAFEHDVFGPVTRVGLAVASRMRAEGLRQRIKRDLDAAGNPSAYSVDEYLALCVLCGAGFAVAGLVGDWLLSGGGHAALVLPVMAVAGFVAPLVTLRTSAQNRVQRIAKQLPYTLDLVAIVMQAGSSFADAVATLIQDQPEDDLNQELRIALNEIEYGVPTATALDHVADRIPLESLRSVIGAVNQAQTLGTPVATVLTLQSEMLRVQRSVRAEKLSASASLRVLIPSMVILIGVVGLVFAPLIVRFFRGELL